MNSIKLLRHGPPVNLQHVFRTPFHKDTYGGLLLEGSFGLELLAELIVQRQKEIYIKLKNTFSRNVSISYEVLLKCLTHCRTFCNISKYLWKPMNVFLNWYTAQYR